MSRTKMYRAAAAAGLSLLLLASLASRPAPMARVAGTMTLSYTEQHALPLGDPSEPILLENQAKGSNRNTGPTDYMDGADVTNIEIADLIQGNGPHQGYITFSKDGETTRNRWSGRVKTVLAADGKTPITTFYGTWTKLSGTGRFDGVSGSGRYRGRMLSPTNYTVEWDGEIALKEKTAAR
jgi:hypothetical protein